MTATAFMNCEKPRRKTPGMFPVQVDPIHDVANGPKGPLQVGFYRNGPAQSWSTVAPGRTIRPVSPRPRRSAFLGGLPTTSGC
jgi:hypothetical protein